MEKAGFEVQSVETIGRHYSHTMRYWYTNWLANQGAMRKKYPAFLCNLWTIFLGWSVVASGAGSATCYQIVAHKVRAPRRARRERRARAAAERAPRPLRAQNTYEFPRDEFIRAEALPPTPFSMPRAKADAFPDAKPGETAK